MSSSADESAAGDPLVARVRALLALADRHAVAEMTVEAGDFRLRLRSGRTREVTSGAPVAVALTGDVDPATPAAPIELTIYAPMIGTFFAGPSPTEPPFVTEGDHIEPGQTVAIIEAMKIMNEIQSDQAGVLVEVLARNGQGVEFGQPLFRLQPLP